MRVTVMDWLLDSDPAIRWQVMRDLTDQPSEMVAAERALVATQGWGARLLALQGADGQWGGRAWSPGWTDTMHTLLMLADLGLQPQSAEARRAVALVRDKVTWQGGYPEDTWDGNRFFVGEVEPCINGRVVSIGAYFGQDVSGIVVRLLGEQMRDGGWNCEAESGSTVGSFGTTINVLEGLLEYERAAGEAGAAARVADVRVALLRGQEYLQERGMFRRRSTGEVADPAFTLFSFPTGYHYDVLRGLDHLRAAGVVPDGRIADAIEVVRTHRSPDGRWPLQNPHPGQLHFQMEEGEGKPSRWNTLRAMRVLRWYEAAGR
jgi:hypothetical protein